MMNVLDGIFEFYKGYGEYVIGRYSVEILVGLLFIFYLSFRLRTKRFYFIRHGRTVLNEAHIKQDSKGNLTEAGREQARRTGEYLREFSIQKIYASPYERTVETAEIIKSQIKVSIHYSPLLVERRNPTEIINRSYFDEEVKKITDLIDLSYHADDFRYSDEENFEDLKKRARTCLDFLARCFPHRIVVVTHGVFLRMLLSYILNQEKLNNSAYVRLSFFNPADNGGITICEYTPWKRLFTKTKGWKIVTYNSNLTD